jgi:hypothetical protein
MGLRRLPKPKPVSAVADLCYFLVVHLVWCNSVFPDEKQRFHILPAMNLSSISGCRAVSLFDTRGELQTDDMDYLWADDAISDQGDQPDDDLCIRLGDVTLEHTGNLTEIGDLSDDATIDSDDNTYLDLDLSTEDQSDTDQTDWEVFSDTDTDTESVISMESDASSVTDDGYLAGDEETRSLLWRHIAFYVIRSPVSGRPNILFAIVSLLHTKGEDRKPRMWALSLLTLIIKC